jgi:hypothetical protein
MHSPSFSFLLFVHFLFVLLMDDGRLPIRMAQRAYDLLTLPHGLNETPAILQVAQVYLLYLEQFQKCPVPNTVETEERFTNMLKHMILERSSIPNAIAKGIDAWAAANKKPRDQQDTHQNDDDNDELDQHQHQQQQRLQGMEDALYRFFTARVGLRFLTQHHIMSSPKRLQEDVAASSSLSPSSKMMISFWAVFKRIVNQSRK